MLRKLITITLLILLSGTAALSAMTIEPSTDIEAVGFGNIISINGIDVEDLMLGTTSFAEKSHVVSRSAGDADNFNLRSVADTMLQPYVETNFDMPVQTIFIVESSGNDSGYMQPLDRNGAAMDDPIPFSSKSFGHAIYGVRNGELGKLAVITLEPMTYGIRILPPDDDYLSIDLVSVSGVEGSIIKGAPEVLIDDDFDDEDLATGGFTLVANDPHGVDSNAVETGSNAEVSTLGLLYANAGIVSNTGVNPLSEAGLTVKWVVTSLSQSTIGNGNTYVVQKDRGFFNSTPHIGLVFNGKHGTSPSGVAVLYDDKSGSSGLISAIQNYDNASWMDGFTLVFTINQTGWAYEVKGLNDLNGELTIIGDSGTWIDSGLAETFLKDLLDCECYVSAFAQGNGTISQYDRCTVMGLPLLPVAHWTFDELTVESANDPNRSQPTP